MKIGFSGKATKKVQWAARFMYMMMNFRVSRKKEIAWLRSWLLKARQLFPSISQPTSETGHTFLRHVSATVRLLATSACCEDVIPEGRQVDWNVLISSVGFPKHSSRNTGRFRNVVSAVMNSASVLRSLVRRSGCSYAVRNGALCEENPFVCPSVRAV